MSLQPGTRKGQYEIVSRLGAGGMGEVYLAHDTWLGRRLALKVLPEVFQTDPERLARFEREARMLASLSHPNIATIFGLEEIDGQRLLAMELAEGEDLSALIARGPIPPGAALPIAGQIAEALSEAHEKGIVHRDLKPANVKVSSDGKVKVLDFGLARMFERETAAHPESTAASPTLTDAGTQTGVILGTAAYMSPEQARGQSVDKRADIWAFGAVFFEMLTGRAAFAESTVGDTLATVLTRDPDWSLLPESTPERICRLLRRCLDKNPKRRLRDIGDALFELDESSRDEAGIAPAQAPRSVARSPWSARLAWAVALCVLAAAAGRFLLQKGAPPEESFRFSMALPADQQTLRWFLTNILAPSPDGRQIAYVASAGGVQGIWLWSAADGEFRSLDGTEGANAPFWSPDGRYLAFIANGELRKIPAAGGVATSICPVSFGSSGTWGSSGTILFTEWGGNDAGLWMVQAEGGQKKLLAAASSPNEIRMWPTFLPDGQRYLFISNTITKPFDQRQACVGRTDSAETVCLTEVNSAVFYAPPGYLVFVRRGTLVAQELDAAKLRIRGDAMVLGREMLWFGPTGAVVAGVSADGRMLATASLRKRIHLEWFDRNGRQVGSLGDAQAYGRYQLSPDGTRLAADIWNSETGSRDLWTFDVGTGLQTRLTFSSADAVSPTWSPDGQRIAYGDAGEGPLDIRILQVRSGGPGEWLLREPGPQLPSHWSADGRFLAYEDFNPGRRDSRRIWLLSPDGQKRLLTQAPVNTYHPRFSPDGRSIAFVSEESGRPEVFVAPVDHSGAAQRVSREGGLAPRWRRDGRELYFLNPAGMLLAARIGADGSPAVTGPEALFRVGSFFQDFTYEAAADGQRFLLYGLDDRREIPELKIALHWNDKLAASSGR